MNVKATSGYIFFILLHTYIDAEFHRWSQLGDSRWNFPKFRQLSSLNNEHSKTTIYRTVTKHKIGPNSGSCYYFSPFSSTTLYFQVFRQLLNSAPVLSAPVSGFPDIKLLFGFVSDSVFVKLNQNTTNTETAMLSNQAENTKTDHHKWQLISRTSNLCRINLCWKSNLNNP